MNDSLSKPVGVVSHDAGGAEIVSSYVKRNKLDCVYSLAGPAVAIFEAKLGAIETSSLMKCVADADWLLCSMGWSDHEWQALSQARKAGKPVTVFLDHWSGYRARFERDGETLLPDVLWVGDNYAEERAQCAFPGLPIKLISNPYFADFKDALNSMPRQSRDSGAGISVLYICEPTAAATDYTRGSGYTDHDALRYFFKCLDESDEPVDTVSLRPHPTESRDKYAWALSESPVNVDISENHSLLEDIARSDWVVGRNSMALVVGILADKRVVSCIPPGGKKCELPQSKIEHMNLIRR